MGGRPRCTNMWDMLYLIGNVIFRFILKGEKENEKTRLLLLYANNV